MCLFKVSIFYPLFFILFTSQFALANSLKNNSSYFLAYSYLTKYKSIAIEEMKRTGIPASITLAQGMYESGFGKSELAVKGNNHFGIKCKSNWTGAKMYYTDDEPDECFRKYNTSRESYRDHSDFLVSRDYYRPLFDLPRTDYKAWANGLKKAGYATDPNYSSKLIAIIQRFKLYEYDYIQEPQEEEIETIPNENDIYIYANDGIFASTIGAPRTSNQLTNLQRIDVILQQSIEERPSWVAPRSLSGGPVIDVDPDQIKGTIQTPIRRATTAESNINTAQETQTSQPTVAETAILNKPNSYKQNQDVVSFEPPIEANLPVNPNFDAKQTPQPTQIAAEKATDSQIIVNNEAIWVNKTKAVRYNYNITPAEIAKQYGLKASDILVYNDLNSEQINIKAGTNVYLEPKKNRYLGSEKIHIVQNKQDMWDIAQQYGLLLSDLYKRNTMRENTQPLLGEQIVLKGKTDYPPKIRYERKQPDSNIANTNTSTSTPQAANTNSIFKRTALDSNNGLVFETIVQPKKTHLTKNAVAKVQYHTIKQGDNLKDIANKFNTTEEKIRAANNLSSNAKLKSGDILLIIQ